MIESVDFNSVTKAFKVLTPIHKYVYFHILFIFNILMYNILYYYKKLFNSFFFNNLPLCTRVCLLKNKILNNLVCSACIVNKKRLYIK